MQFLRVRKFRMDDAFQTVERMYLIRKRYPKFFQIDIDDAMKMFDSGFCYPLSGRDAEGRKVVMVRFQKWNTDLYTVYDATRLLAYVVTVLLEEEETQVAGYIFVLDYANTTLKHIISPVDLIDFMNFLKHCSACRQKGNYILNLPSYANILIEIALTVLSEKLKKRLFLLKQGDELKSHIDPAMLPKEYGGQQSEADMMKEFLAIRDKYQANLRKIIDFQVDSSKVPHEKIWSYGDEEAVGSFRKLEID